MDPTTWSVQVRWGDRRLHAEALEREGKNELVLGPDLGIDSRAKFTWTELGLKVALTPGFTGQARMRGDRAVPLSALVQRGRAREVGDSLELLLEPAGDSLRLDAGTLRIDVKPAFQPMRRLKLDVKVLGTLALALLAVGLVILSVVTSP